MGTRTVQYILNERQENGRSFQKIIFGKYKWRSYNDVDKDVTAIVQAFNLLGLKKGQNVVIYAETRMEWMVSALSCFKNGLPGMF